MKFINDLTMSQQYSYVLKHADNMSTITSSCENLELLCYYVL